MKKKLIGFVMLFILLFTMCAAAKAANTVHWRYNEREHILQIEGSGRMNDYASLSDVPWYRYRDEIEEIYVDSLVQSIGKYAFSSMPNLKKVSLPGTLEEVGERAFENCPLIETIYLSYASKIGNYAFSKCTSLSNVHLSRSLTYVGQYAFQYCSSLSSITLPSTLKTIGSYAFQYCSSLSSITLPSTLTTISNGTFKGSGLEQITIPESVTTLGNECFKRCSKLTQITIPESVTTIGQDCFYGCNQLSQITIPSRVRSIQNGCFSHCSALTSISLGKNVQTIGMDAFSDCSMLANATIQNGSIGPKAFADSGLVTITLGDGVTSIGQEAFSNCNQLKTVVVGQGLQSIASKAFYLCKALQQIALPDSLTTIGASAFEQCEALASVSFGSGLTTLGDHAFARCMSLTRADLPDSLTTAGAYAFWSCAKLTSVNISSGLTELPDAMFTACASLTSVTIPASVQKIGMSFSACRSLKTVKLNEGLLEIGYASFCGCTALKQLRIPDSVTTIGNRAFQEAGLVSVTLPLHIELIDSGAFNCESLTDVYYPGRQRFLTFVEIRGYNDPLLNATWHYEQVAPEQFNVIMGSWTMSEDGKSCFIQRPEILGSSGHVSIAYNIYDSQSRPINYFYSLDPYVAATCPYNETYNVFVVVTDLETGESETVMTGWFNVTGYEEETGLTVRDPEWSMSPDGKSCFIYRPVITGATGSYTIAYNIYDSDGNAINYFYSKDEAVAATCPYNGTFNVFVVVKDQVESKTVMTGWFTVTGYDKASDIFKNLEEIEFEMEIDPEELEETPEEGPETLLWEPAPDDAVDEVPMMTYDGVAA